MILLSPDFEYANLLSVENKLNREWQHTLFPLAEDFFHPHFSFFHHQITEETFLLKHPEKFFFLKDGVLGIVALLAKILKNKEKFPGAFAIPLSLAPLIPLELHDKFVFYQYIHNSSVPDKSLTKAIIVIGTLDLHTSFNILLEDLAPFAHALKEIIIVSNNFKKATNLNINDNTKNTLQYIKNVSSLTEKFSQVSIEFGSLDLFLSLNLNDYLFVNTNHYNYFCGEDFLSYYYFFKTGKVPLSFLNTPSQFFTEKKVLPLVKNLSFQTFLYKGPQVIGPEELLSLSRIDLPNRDKAKNLEHYYTQEIQFWASEFAKKLLQVNLELRSRSC